MIDLSPIIVDADGWHFRYDTAQPAARTGEKSLRLVIPTDVTLPPGAACSVIQTVALKPDTAYSFSVWYQGHFDATGIAVDVVWQTGAASGPSYRQRLEGFAQSATWQQIELAFETGPAVDQARVGLYLLANGEVYFDDAALVERDAEPANLLANPGFEQDLQGWAETGAPRQAGAAEISNGRFVPWGLNYDRTMVGGEDYIIEEMLALNLPKVIEDMEKAKALGANVLRIFPQVAHCEPVCGQMDEAVMVRFDQVVAAARRLGLRLDISGLSHIDQATIPDWYRTGDDEEILEGEAYYWASFAERYRGEAAIFCFNLQNEPYINAVDGAYGPIGCFVMSGGRKFCYCHPHPKEVNRSWTAFVHDRYPDEAGLRQAWPDYPQDGETYASPNLATPLGDAVRQDQGQGKRSNEERGRRLDFERWRSACAHHWVKTLVTAIRGQDPKRLITLGFLPTSLPLTPSGYASFNPQEVGALLDFVSIHLYPTYDWKLQETTGEEPDQVAVITLELLLRAAYANSPVIVEEWFAFGPQFKTPEHAEDWFRRFIEATTDDASGWLSFYHASLPEDISLSEIQAGRLGPEQHWQRLFKEAAPDMAAHPAIRAEADEVWELALADLILSPDVRRQTFLRYLEARRQGKQIDIHLQAEW